VDGTVTSVLPAIHGPNPNAPSVRTDSLVAIDAVLKGTMPNKSATILLEQGGGKAGGWDVTVNGDTLVVQGERYVLFLAADELSDSTKPPGLPRYAVLGIWAGKVKVTNGKIAFLPRAHPQLHAYDNTDVDEFIQTIRDKIANPPQTKGAPIHPTPPAARQP